jgi:hypothetical protein
MRSLYVTATVCAACLAATALGFGHAVVNPDVPTTWLATDVGLAALALLAPGGGLLAGGLVSNALVAQLCGGVPDFVPLFGRILSPGDLAIVCGLAPILVGLVYRYSKPVSDESFASDC